MWNMGLKMIIGCLCGYLYIKFSLNHSSSSFIEELIMIIMHPLRFFLDMIMFFIAFVMNASLIKLLFNKTFEVWQKKKYWNNEILIGYTGLILMIAYLINLDFVQALILFSLSFFYVIISMDA
jgi:hypothetical protein